MSAFDLRQAQATVPSLVSAAQILILTPGDATHTVRFLTAAALAGAAFLAGMTKSDVVRSGGMDGG